MLETWKRTAAGWRITNDVWSSGLPEGSVITCLKVTHQVADAVVDSTLHVMLELT